MADPSTPPPSHAPLLRANPWWNQALVLAAGDPSKLVPLRDLGAFLAESPLWSLAPGGRTLQGGRLGLAVLLDSAWRHAPQAYGALIDALANWRRVDGFAAVKKLWLATMAVHLGWCRSLGAPTSPMFAAMQTLATLSDRIPFDSAAAADDEAGRRGAATHISAYAKGTSHLQRYALGAWHAGRWSTKDEDAQRLVRVGIAPAALFRDIVASSVNSAWAMVGVFAMWEAPREPPDPAAFDCLRVAPLPGPQRTPSRPAVPVVQGVNGLLGGPQNGAPAAPQAHVPEAERWWAVCKAWATKRGRSVDVLLDLATAIEARPMWPLVATHLQTLGQSMAWRAQQRGRMVLGVVIDEFFRAFPQDVEALLDVLAPPENVVLTLEHCGRFEELYDAVYDVWAKTLRSETSPAETPTARILNQMGSIVPWDDTRGLDKAAREQKQNAAIDRAYAGRDVSSNDWWTGIYWSSVAVRNDTVHNNPQRLLNRVRPVDLRLDLLLFHGLAGLRFLAQLANRGPSKVTMPNVACMP